MLQTSNIFLAYDCNATLFCLQNLIGSFIILLVPNLEKVWSMNRAKAINDVRLWYEEFVRGFHSDDIEFMRNVNLKYDHTQRVVLEVRGIGHSLQLKESTIDLHIMAAYLHDIGRFRQLERYNTFSDRESVNHAELSRKIVEENKVLRFLAEDEQNIVIEAIANHNLAEVPQGLPAKTDTALRVVRDADKIDTLRILSRHYNEPYESRNKTVELNLPNSNVVDKAIFKALERGDIVKVNGLHSLSELKLLQLSWLFDINYLWTFLVLEKRAYIKKIVQTLPGKIQNHRAILKLLEFQRKKALGAKEAGLKER